jgi:hypothetical protein
MGKFGGEKTSLHLHEELKRQMKRSEAQLELISLNSSGRTVAGFLCAVPGAYKYRNILFSPPALSPVEGSPS